MRASQNRSQAAFGYGEDVLSHEHPLPVPEGLWPALLDGEITIEPLKTGLSSADLWEELASRGAELETEYIPLYRSSTYVGTPRSLDNSDWLKGKKPLYDTVAALAAIRTPLIELIKEMRSVYDAEKASGSLIASMELQDLEKITAQQWKPTGWFLQSPVTDVDVPQIPVKCAEVMRRVCRRYASVLKEDGFLDKSLLELTLLDSDPPDTMTGSPTWVGGQGITHAARLDALRAFPSPEGLTGAEWAEHVRAMDGLLGLPDSLSYSPVLSTRQGPFKKETILWVKDAYGYHANYKAKGLYSRTRFVYPAPYTINFVLSPMYELCSTARQRIPGLWHDPEKQAAYVKALQKQGKFAYSIDFSGMDTGMWPHIIQLILSSLIDAGFPKFPLEAFSELYRTMSVAFPDYFGDSDCITMLKGPIRPWCSGFKLTSEFDTIYGASVLLSTLEEVRPGTLRQWEEGRFTFGELGDDIILTLDKEVDPKIFSQVALRNWGAKLEIIEDALFLKWMLPIAPEIKKPTRPFSRFIQQTFFNEDRYDGVEGGVKPDAVLRLGLTSRLAGLVDHPHFSRWWPKLWPIVAKLGYVERSPEEFKRALASGKVPATSSEDIAEIAAYGERVPTYYYDIFERSKYQHSALELKEALERLGIAVQEPANSKVIRQAYWDALYHRPTPNDIEVLRGYIPE